MTSSLRNHRPGWPRVLICFYSMTGNTRRLAHELRDATGAELEELQEPRPRRGLIGVLRALFDALTRRLPPLLPIHHDPGELDLLIVGGPIWASRLAGPVRSYLSSFGRRAHRLAFFCTEGSQGSDMAFADLEMLCRQERVGSLVVDAHHLDSGAHSAALQAFIGELHQALHGVADPGAMQETPSGPTARHRTVN